MQTLAVTIYSTWSTKSGSPLRDPDRTEGVKWLKTFILVATPLAALLGTVWGGLQLLEDRASRIASNDADRRNHELQISRILAEERKSQRSYQQRLAEEQTKHAEAQNERARAELQQSIEKAKQARYDRDTQLAKLEEVERELEIAREKLLAEEKLRAEERAIREESILIQATGRVLANAPDSSDILTLLQNLSGSEYRPEIVDALVARLSAGSSLAEARMIWRHLVSADTAAEPIAQINADALKQLDAQVLSLAFPTAGSGEAAGSIGDVCRGAAAYTDLPGEIPSEVMICHYLETLLGRDCSWIAEQREPMEELLQSSIAKVWPPAGSTDQIPAYDEQSFRKAAFLLAESNMFLLQDCARLSKEMSKEEVLKRCDYASVPGYRRILVPNCTFRIATYWRRSDRLAHDSFGGIGRTGPAKRLEQVCSGG